MLSSYRTAAWCAGQSSRTFPNDHVTIQLPTGEFRTFAYSEVVRAGPADQPSAPSPAAAVAVASMPSAVRLTVESESAGFILHRLTDTTTVSGYHRTIDAFDVVCTIPCTATIVPGTYYFGLSRERGRPGRIASPFTIEGDTTLTLEHESRGDQRLIGGLVLAGGLLAGGGLLTGSLYHYFVGRGHFVIYDELAITGMVFGGLLALAGAAIGGALLGMRDHVDLRTGTLRF